MLNLFWLGFNRELACRSVVLVQITLLNLIKMLSSLNLEADKLIDSTTNCFAPHSYNSPWPLMIVTLVCRPTKER